MSGTKYSTVRSTVQSTEESTVQYKVKYSTNYSTVYSTVRCSVFHTWVFLTLNAVAPAAVRREGEGWGRKGFNK